MDTSSTSPRLAFRMKAELKERIETAAQLLGLSLTDFVLATLSERASEVLDRESTLRLSNRDRKRFLAELSRPGKVIPALKQAMEAEHKRRRG